MNLTDLLKSLTLLSFSLLIGTLLRAKIRFFQDTFIPASVLGGLLLLIAGPQMLNLTGELGIPSAWYEYYALYPGVLIVPIVAGVPLGLHIHNNAGAKSDKGVIKNALPLFFISLGVAMLQFVIGFIVHVLFTGTYDLYDQFGIELGVGFVGGHGTAGTLGSTLKDMKLPWWDISQGVATTIATAGLVGGILIGILFINWACRRGKTAILDHPSSISKALKKGYETETSKQSSLGRETTFSTSIDTLAFHCALIFLACGCGYACQNKAAMLNVPILKDISVWAYGMICMSVIWWCMCIVHIDNLVDVKVKGHITGNLTDFAVIGAIASLPIRSVMVYIIPIMVMCLLGFICTILWLYFLSKRYIRGYWFEQMVATLGMATGVFITGILLLRICDPESKSPVLAVYSIAYTAMSIIYFALLNLFITLPTGGNVLITITVGSVITALCLLGVIISSKAVFKGASA